MRIKEMWKNNEGIGTLGAVLGYVAGLFGLLGIPVALVGIIFGLVSDLHSLFAVMNVK
jgi:hypothetical protein